MSTLSRPKLGSRAISDMQPLMNPALKISDQGKDLGRGTQALSGGARVVSGGRTALGGIAPLSPFLPLPPAIELPEVDKQQQEEVVINARSNSNRFLSVQNQASIHTRSISGSNADGDNKAPLNRGHLRPAPLMIRSYSMPVATQSDYEAQRETIKRRHQFAAQNRIPSTEERPWEANWVQDSQQLKGRPLYHTTTSMKLKINNSNENAMTSSMSSMGSKKEPPRRKASNSPRLQPRSPLSVITANTHNPASIPDNGVDMDLGSGSDEADVITPKANSPHHDYFSKSIDMEGIETSCHDAFSEFIHPDHLQPPPAFGF